MPKRIVIIKGASKPAKKYRQHWTDSMSKMIIIIEGARKHLEKLIIFVGHDSPPSPTVANCEILVKNFSFF